MSKYGIITIENIIDQANEYLSEDDIELSQHAYHYAKKAQTNQYRKSGEAYIVHPVQVAGILVDLNIDPVIIAGGFMHNFVWNTDITIDIFEVQLDAVVVM